jgi:hypothetical protein
MTEADRATPVGLSQQSKRAPGRNRTCDTWFRKRCPELCASNEVLELPLDACNKRDLSLGLRRDPEVLMLEQMSAGE